MNTWNAIVLWLLCKAGTQKNLMCTLLSVSGFAVMCWVRTSEVGLPGVEQRCPSFVSDTSGNLSEYKYALRISTPSLRAQVSRSTVIQKPFGLSGVLICCRVPEHRRPGPGYNRSRSYQTCGSVLQLCLQNHSTRLSVLQTPAKIPLDYSQERTEAEQNM